MSDTPRKLQQVDSQARLIEVHHVGVTAKLHSPLTKCFQLPSSSSDIECDRNHQLDENKSKYSKFSNDAYKDTDTLSEESCKVLYAMRASQGTNVTYKSPSKIEFQLLNRPLNRNYRKKPTRKRSHLRFAGKVPEAGTKNNAGPSILKKWSKTIFKSFGKTPKNERSKKNVFFDIHDPQEPTTQKEARIGIYDFDHGCADYLSTFDCPAAVLSDGIAERANQYATRFWAEIFGVLHIAVAFLVAFFLQCYRFILFSMINTLLVGFLHMTSDYLVKPLLTVLFNGFLQPPMILIYNILTSVRDFLAPVADTINNFAKPVATVGQSIRLVHVNYTKRNIVKEV